MDCEKFDQYVMDALYGELDELTLEALKRHVEGCARCGPVWSGLKNTRSAVTLPLEEPDAGLEERILAAERSVQHTAPIHRKIMRAAAWAGSVVMRPQFAMAAVFMLVVGSSLMLLRGRPGTMTPPLQVSEQGRPEAPQAATAQAETRAPTGAAGAPKAAADEKESPKDRGTGHEESDRLREDGLMDAPPPNATPAIEGGMKNEAMATAAAPTAPAETMGLSGPCDIPNLEQEAKGGGDGGTKAQRKLAECQKQLSYAKDRPSAASTASAKPTSTTAKPPSTGER